MYQLVRAQGHKWSQFERFFPGRTSIALKQHWYAKFGPAEMRAAKKDIAGVLDLRLLAAKKGNGEALMKEEETRFGVLVETPAAALLHRPH